MHLEVNLAHIVLCVHACIIRFNALICDLIAALLAYFHFYPAADFKALSCWVRCIHCFTEPHVVLIADMRVLRFFFQVLYVAVKEVCIQFGEKAVVFPAQIRSNGVVGKQQRRRRCIDKEELQVVLQRLEDVNKLEPVVKRHTVALVIVAEQEVVGGVAVLFTQPFQGKTRRFSVFLVERHDVVVVAFKQPYKRSTARQRGQGIILLRLPVKGLYRSPREVRKLLVPKGEFFLRLIPVYHLLRERHIRYDCRFLRSLFADDKKRTEVQLQKQPVCRLFRLQCGYADIHADIVKDFIAEINLQPPRQEQERNGNVRYQLDELRVKARNFEKCYAEV